MILNIPFQYHYCSKCFVVKRLIFTVHEPGQNNLQLECHHMCNEVFTLDILFLVYWISSWIDIDIILSSYYYIILSSHSTQAESNEILDFPFSFRRFLLFPSFCRFHSSASFLFLLFKFLFFRVFLWNAWEPTDSVMIRLVVRFYWSNCASKFI